MTLAIAIADHPERKPRQVKMTVPLPRTATADAITETSEVIAELPGFGNIPSLVRVVPTNAADNSVSTRDTLQLMACMSRQAAYSPAVQSAVAASLRNGGTELRTREQLSRVFYWIKQHVKFVEDERRVAEIFGIPLTDVDQELLISPERLLTMPTPMGDCDDFSMLTASMLLHIGAVPMFVAIRADQQQPWRYSHVFTRAILPTSEILAMDTSHGDYVGWESAVNLGEMTEVV